MKKWELMGDEVSVLSEAKDQSFGMYVPIARVFGEGWEENGEIMSKAPELLNALHTLTEACPLPLHCDAFHHCKEDEHGVDEGCKPYNRYSKALKEAEDLLESIGW